MKSYNCPNWIVGLAVATCTLGATATHAETASGASPLVNYVFSGVAGDYTKFRDQLPRVGPGHWVDNPELRMSPEMDAQDQWTETYSFRFKPIGTRERRAQVALDNAETALANESLRDVASSAIAQRLRALVRLAHSEFELAAAERELTLAKTALDNRRMSAGRGGLGATRLQDALLDLEFGQHQLVQLRGAVEDQRALTVDDYLAVTALSEPGLSARLKAPPAIELWLQNQQMIEVPDNLDVVRAQRALALDKSQRGFGFSMMELSYENKGIDSYNFTVGLRLPFGANRHASERRVRDVIVAEQVAHAQAQERAGLVTVQGQRLARAISTYANHRQAIEALASRQGSVSASSRTSLQTHSLRLHKVAAQAHIDVLESYVVMLHALGLLQPDIKQDWLAGEA